MATRPTTATTKAWEKSMLRWAQTHGFLLPGKLAATFLPPTLKLGLEPRVFLNQEPGFFQMTRILTEEFIFF